MNLDASADIMHKVKHIDRTPLSLYLNGGNRSMLIKLTVPYHARIFVFRLQSTMNFSSYLTKMAVAWLQDTVHRCQARLKDCHEI